MHTLNLKLTNTNNMKEALELILEAMIFRVQDEKSYETKSIESFCAYNKAKEIAKARMIKTLEEL
jgi:hypothetical protein